MTTVADHKFLDSGTYTRNSINFSNNASSMVRKMTNEQDFIKDFWRTLSAFLWKSLSCVCLSLGKQMSVLLTGVDKLTWVASHSAAPYMSALIILRT